jgi:hypothetical protein
MKMSAFLLLTLQLTEVYGASDSCRPTTYHDRDEFKNIVKEYGKISYKPTEQFPEEYALWCPRRCKILKECIPHDWESAFDKSMNRYVYWKKTSGEPKKVYKQPIRVAGEKCPVCEERTLVKFGEFVPEGYVLFASDRALTKFDDLKKYGYTSNLKPVPEHEKNLFKQSLGQAAPSNEFVGNSELPLVAYKVLVEWKKKYDAEQNMQFPKPKMLMKFAKALGTKLPFSTTKWSQKPVEAQKYVAAFQLLTIDQQYKYTGDQLAKPQAAPTQPPARNLQQEAKEARWKRKAIEAAKKRAKKAMAEKDADAETCKYNQIQKDLHEYGYSGRRLGGVSPVMLRLLEAQA